TPIWDLVVKGTDMVVATHGRSFWILDDLTPLHQMREEIAVKSAHLFAPRDTVRYRLYGRAYDPKSKERINYKMTGPVTVAYRLVDTPDGRTAERFYDAGQNPPEGVIIHYWLKDARAPVQLEVFDAAGTRIRSFSSKRTPTTDAPTEGEQQ